MATSEKHEPKLSATETAANGEVAKVSIKIPPFWTEKPEIWFYQVEAQFSISGIKSEETKFHYLIAQMEPRFVENLWDIVTDTNENKYTAAKERLLNTFKESENRRIQRLVSEMELGDLRPTQLLQKMRSLATDGISDNVLKTLFLQKMPDSIRNIQIVSNEDIRKLAEMADRIVEMHPNREIYATSRSDIQQDSEINSLRSQIVSLERKINRLQLERSRSRSRAANQNSRGRSASRKRFNPADDVLIASSSPEEHRSHLKIVFQRLNDYGLRINVIKSVFGVDSLEFLGYKISAKGSRPLPEKVKAILEYPLPNTLQKLRTFLDTLSRIANVNLPSIDYDQIADAQIDDDELKQLRLYNKSLKFKQCQLPSGKSLWCDTSTSKKYPAVTKLPDPNQPVKQNTVHYINTKGPPVSAKPRKLAPDRLKIAKAEFQRMIHLGHMRPSISSYSSPLHMVSKKGSIEWRPVDNYRALNAQNVKDKYPIVCIADFTSELHGKQMFSHIDLAYHQILINPDDGHKTAICTPFGLFESLRMQHKNKKKHPRPKAPNSTEQLQWNYAAIISLNASKEAFAKATLLRHPIPGDKLSLWVDASNAAVDEISPTVIDFKEFASAQSINDGLQQLLKSNNSSLKIKEQYLSLEDIHLYCDIPQNNPDLLFLKTCGN
ncbi:uncharacterized protein LOC129962361 [Argiope bruennichi]|uniref:uncharacterized protein LOC129962361 n=1 Tax=Argiope bruennichi TaxID=94029 RepID=UPI0024951F6E|nr:uncharacterized protein LOC129962361 [Argiope bruennichi]